MMTKASSILVSVYVSILLTVALAIWYSLDNEFNFNSYWQNQIDWFLAINRWGSSFSTFWGNITILGDASVLLPIVLAVFFRWFVQICVATFIALPFSIVVGLIKMLVAMPRPATVIDLAQFTIVGEILAGYTSLPSGHTVVFFTMITVLLTTFVKKLNPASWLVWLAGLSIAGVLALSRVMVGAHWPLDLFFGAVTGIIIGAIAQSVAEKNQLVKRWLSSRNFSKLYCAIMMLWAFILVYRALQLPIVLALSLWLAVLACIVVIFLVLRQRITLACHK